jgi:hypothetical protein
MSLFRRFLGFLVLLLSAACFLGCVAGIVLIWEARQDVSDRTQKVVTRIEVGLERALAVTQDLGRALEKARTDVDRVNQGVAASHGDKKNRPPPNILRGLVKQVAPGLNELGGRLAISSDAAVVVTSLLQSLQELPLSQTGRIDAERLQGLTRESSRLSASLQKLEALVGEGDGTVAEETATAGRDVDRVLRKCQTTVADWQSDLESARKELPLVEAEVPRWMTLLAIVVTAVCAWVALSQISLAAHALKWCRG